MASMASVVPGVGITGVMAVSDTAMAVSDTAMVVTTVPGDTDGILHGGVVSDMVMQVTMATVMAAFTADFTTRPTIIIITDDTTTAITEAEGVITTGIPLPQTP